MEEASGGKLTGAIMIKLSVIKIVSNSLFPQVKAAVLIKKTSQMWKGLGLRNQHEEKLEENHRLVHFCYLVSMLGSLFFDSSPETNNQEFKLTYGTEHMISFLSVIVQSKTMIIKMSVIHTCH